jgi:hypothetical protein
MAKDDRFSPKEVVVGVKANGKQMALHKQTVRTKKVNNTSLAGVPLVALYDPDLDVVRVFVRQIKGEITNFSSEKGRLVDELTGSLWTADGRAVEGKMSGNQLKQQAAYDVMWFAWHAFYPKTQVLS